MGRVDEAMRRAAGAASDPDASDPPIEAGPVTVGRETVAAEFPTEGSRTRLRPVMPSASASGTRAAEPAPETMLPGVVEHLTTTLSRKVVIDRETDPVSKEQYRRLAASLHAAQAASDLKVVMVSSAVASEGKSLTAANLAMTLSESYQKSVFLIDGDLRRPTQHVVFGLDSSPGLTDGLVGQEDRLRLHRVTPHLTVLTAGEPTTDPMAVLTSERMGRLIQEARDRFEWVIIDTPPVGLISDANLLAEMADGALLVVRAESTPYEVVQRALAMLGRERVLGVVLNQVREGENSVYKYQQYYQTSSRGSGPGLRR